MKQKLHVICWDGVEYNRETSSEEIDQLEKKGVLSKVGDNLTADFRVNCN